MLSSAVTTQQYSLLLTVNSKARQHAAVRLLILCQSLQDLICVLNLITCTAYEAVILAHEVLQLNHLSLVVGVAVFCQVLNAGSYRRPKPCASFTYFIKIAHLEALSLSSSLVIAPSSAFILSNRLLIDFALSF